MVRNEWAAYENTARPRITCAIRSTKKRSELAAAPTSMGTPRTFDSEGQPPHDEIEYGAHYQIAQRQRQQLPQVGPVEGKRIHRVPQRPAGRRRDGRGARQPQLQA